MILTGIGRSRGLPGADAGLHAGMHPVGGVDIGGLGAPAAEAGGQVGDHREYRQPGYGFERGQLSVGVGPLAARTPSRWTASPRAGPRQALAQQPGQLGHVGFLPLSIAGARTHGRRPGAIQAIQAFLCCDLAASPAAADCLYISSVLPLKSSNRRRQSEIHIGTALTTRRLASGGSP
jgi:hypothetical protein